MLATHEMPDTITLNVGGELFRTRLETLQLVPDSPLGKMFEDNSAYGKLPRDENGVVFFDRDPKAFSSVLDFLQRGGRVIGPPESDALLARVRDEADYFGLEGMVAKLDVETRERKSRNAHQAVIQTSQLKAIQDLNEGIGHLFGDDDGESLLHKVNANLDLIAYSAHRMSTSLISHEEMPDDTPQDLYDHVRVPVE